MKNLMKAGIAVGLAMTVGAAAAGNYTGYYEVARYDGNAVLVDVGEISAEDKPACHTNSRWDYKMTDANSDAVMRELVLTSPRWYMTIQGSGNCVGNVETVKSIRVSVGP